MLNISTSFFLQCTVFFVGHFWHIFLKPKCPNLFLFVSSLHYLSARKNPLHNIIWRYIILTYDMYLAKPIEIKIVSLFYACVTSHRYSTATGWEFDPVITIFLIFINMRSTFLLSKSNFIILSVLYICRHHNMLQFLMSQISKVANC